MFLNFEVWEEGGELCFHHNKNIGIHGTAVLWENLWPSLTVLTNMRAPLEPNSSDTGGTQVQIRGFLRMSKGRGPDEVTSPVSL